MGILIIIIIMAIFSVTTAAGVSENRDFKTSNVNIHIDTIQLRISELQITSDEWSGIYI